MSMAYTSLTNADDPMLWMVCHASAFIGEYAASEKTYQTAESHLVRIHIRRMRCTLTIRPSISKRLK
jgi:hypothetical protein